MKKMFLSLLMLISTSVVFAQLQEVRGVEIKGSKYGEERDDYCSYNGITSHYNGTFCKYGFIFTNLHSFPISVEAELYKRNGGFGYHSDEVNVVDSKTFILKSKESYLWGTDIIYQFNKNTGDEMKAEFLSGSCVPVSMAFLYYVKFKAYKIE